MILAIVLAIYLAIGFGMGVCLMVQDVERSLSKLQKFYLLLILTFIWPWFVLEAFIREH